MVIDLGNMQPLVRFFKYKTTNNMATMRKLSLAFSLTVITNGLLGLRIWNFVRKL